MRLKTAVALPCLCVALALVLAAEVVAQSPCGGSVRFDVATIKPSDPSNNHESMSLAPGGYFRATASVKTLIEQAYGVRAFQITGGPKWLGQKKFDIVGRFGEAEDLAKLTPVEQDSFEERQMLRIRALLTDRFQLVVHSSVKTMPVYALTVAKSGPKLNPPKAGEAHRLFTPSPGKLACYSASMTELAEELPEAGVGRLVVDETGLRGRYDFFLQWTPDDLNAGARDFDSEHGSIFAALEEELGLKLVSQKAPEKVLVIDHVEPPSPN
ncbi:MAG: TIGR03435 family protein [Acidobacteriaceae bacterium]